MNAAITNEERLSRFIEDGYTVFENVYSREQVEAFTAKFHQLREEIFGDAARSNYLVDNLIERAPVMMLPVVNNPLILDFAEMVIGPFVQISDSVIFAFEPVLQADAEGKVNGWHRDRYAQVPGQGYHHPTALSVLTYLQDMTEEFGPLRVLPGSHRRPITLSKEEVVTPHPQERKLSLKAGDVAFFHHALLHTGSPNTSGKLRIFAGGSFNCTWMRHKDNHSGPNVKLIIDRARAANDHRTLRLFGVDDHLERRVNAGGTVADEVRWAEWAAADKAAVIR